MGLIDLAGTQFFDKVKERLQADGKEVVLQALDIIERSRVEEITLNSGTSVKQLQDEALLLKKRLKKFQEMFADELMSINDFKENKAEVDARLDEIQNLIANYQMEAAKKEKQTFDMQAIRERLNTYIDLKNYRVSEEMIDMFVERFMYMFIILCAL